MDNVVPHVGIWTDREYLTKAHMVIYYSESVKYSGNTPKTVERVKNGLQHLIDTEFASSPESIFFVYEIEGFEDCMRYQMREYNCSRATSIVDERCK